MIYLTTGGNGAGKTLFTLKDVRDQQLRENRPVYYHGFVAKQVLTDWGWQQFDPKKWQDLPDGSICVFDECQNEFPAKQQGEVPDYINAVAQHRRRRGFDFWMITPHPSLISLNIRRLIESPSWHRHLKRTAGAAMVSELKFNFAEIKCEQPGSGARGVVSMRAYPKQVYDWYDSASLHTGKVRIPNQAYVLIFCALLVPVLGYFGYTTVYNNVTKHAKPPLPGQQAPAAAARTTQQAAGPAQLTPAQYVDSRTPRIADFPHTAPAYDQVTAPVSAPFPAACVQMGKRCDCYSQQATLLQVTLDTCFQIVKRGFFVDWGQQQAQQQNQTQQAQQAHSQTRQHAQNGQQDQQQQQARTVPMPKFPDFDPGVISPADLTSALRLKNPAYAGFPRSGS